jgi:hypothetical protein
MEVVYGGRPPFEEVAPLDGASTRGYVVESSRLVIIPDRVWPSQQR